MLAKTEGRGGIFDGEVRLGEKCVSVDAGNREMLSA